MLEIDDEVFNYILFDEYKKICDEISIGTNKVIYEDKNIRVRVRKIGKKIFTIKMNFEEISIDEVVKNIILVQA
jgi:hypothetical protein